MHGMVQVVKGFRDSNFQVMAFYLFAAEFDVTLDGFFLFYCFNLTIILPKLHYGHF